MAEVILVDEFDNDIGLYDKEAAHREGLLHRAFSIFIFNDQNELLLQKRAAVKYHSPGLWTNSCCSHDVRDMDLIEFAKNRLQHEMGIVTALRKIGTITYDLDCGNQMREYEYNHLLLGHSNEQPTPNPEEVDEFRYMTIPQIEKEINDHPEQFTSWFKFLLPEIKSLI